MSAVLPLAILCGLALGAVAASLFAVMRVQSLARAGAGCGQPPRDQLEAEVQSLRQTVEALSAQIQDVRQQPRQISVPALPKPGLNLSKRSQALRMHRRGDPPDEISGALDIPMQEVDLLLKVHKIVIGSIG